MVIFHIGCFAASKGQYSGIGQFRPCFIPMLYVGIFTHILQSLKEKLRSLKNSL
jgi:hypothetical protein